MIETPLLPQIALAIGENGERRFSKRRTRQARPPLIRDVRRHIAAAWFMKSGYHFRWNGLVYANVRALMRVFRACEIMAAWDIYLDQARRDYKLYLMEHEMLRLMEHSEFKILCDLYDQRLIGRQRLRGNGISF